MARRSSRSYLVPHLFRRLFSKRETISFPSGPLELSDAYRGEVTIDLAHCLGCGRCVDDCPSGALTVERRPGGGVQIVLQRDRCGICGLCVVACPQEAIRQLSSFTSAVTSRADLRTEWIREGPPRRKRSSKE